MGHDLGEGRLVPLPLGLHREADHRLAGGVDPQLAAVGHAEAEDVHVPAGPGADPLREERQADPHEGALAGLGVASPLLGLLRPQLLVAGGVERHPQRRGVVAGVVLPAGLRGVGELLRLDQVLHPQLGRVHTEVVGQDIDHPLHEVDGLGDAERAGVGHPARRLVGVDGRDLAVGRLEVVAAGEDREEPGRELGRLGGGVEGAVVGDRRRPQGQDLAIAGGGDLAVHVVVAGETRRHEVLGPVLHPLHRRPGDDRGHHHADVAGVDRHLVAEPAAEVGRDHLDLVLGQAGHQGVDGAVGVGRLAGDPAGELAGDLVHGGHAAARLHGGRVRAGIEEIGGRHDDVAAFEHLVAGGGVARLPVVDVVVRPALEVGADHRRVGVEGPVGVDHRREQLVLDLDQLEGVAGGVAVLGHHVGDLLALEADLVGGQHRLHVAGERRHPGQAHRGQQLAGDHGPHLGVGLGGRHVERPDPGVGVGAAQHGAVEHAGQLDVVEVAALPPQEAGILLAEHVPEADGVAGRAERHAGVRRGGGAHAGTPSATGCSAAQRMARTMFS